jgi:hypothetical protein
MKVEIDCSMTKHPDKREVWTELTEEDHEQSQSDEAQAEVLQRQMKRAERNMLLASSDWTQVPDSPLSEESREAWRVWRQVLRNDPLGPWPEPPV